MLECKIPIWILGYQRFVESRKLAVRATVRFCGIHGYTGVILFLNSWGFSPAAHLLLYSRNSYLPQEFVIFLYIEKIAWL